MKSLMSWGDYISKPINLTMPLNEARVVPLSSGQKPPRVNPIG